MFRNGHCAVHCSIMTTMPVKTQKDDRRTARTKSSLRSALINLILEKRYDEITVQDIIDRANVGRSTFYVHCLDKDDLLISDFTRVLDMVSQHMRQFTPDVQGTLPSLALFFEHV